MTSIFRRMHVMLKELPMPFGTGLFKPGPTLSLSRAQKRFLVKFCAGCLLLIAFILLAGRIRDAQSDKSKAYLVAQDFVSERLVRPLSAEFPPRSAGGIEVEYLGDHRYLISGYLHSLNTFGNLQQSNYMCIIRYAGAGEWVDEKVTFE